MVSPSRFAVWLNAAMTSRGLSQADLARALGVADAQVSRWRRGQVVPTVQSLQRMAEALGVDRVTLDGLAGYPVAEGGSSGTDPAVQAELAAYQARLYEVMRRRLPRRLWRPYMDACEALAESMAASLERADAAARRPPEGDGHRGMGFGG